MPIPKNWSKKKAAEYDRLAEALSKKKGVTNPWALAHALMKRKGRPPR